MTNFTYNNIMHLVHRYQIPTKALMMYCRSIDRTVDTRATGMVAKGQRTAPAHGDEQC
eukprot:m.326269 g.326269  ORF g.326269 m.326269 type:complete len:58 (-) comp20401_c0_seq1:209-382(-)